MKRIALILLVVAVAMGSRAQSEGFEFMGVPLEGDITTFNQALLQKDFTLSNPGQHDGTNIYKGTYEGEQAYGFVEYEPQTDFVYRAIAQISRSSKDLILEKYQTIRDLIETKYAQSEGLKVLQEKKERFDSVMHGRAKNPFEWKAVTRQNGYETATFMIPDHLGNILGDITLFINESPSRDPETTDYNLFIQYTLWKNQEDL